MTTKEVKQLCIKHNKSYAAFLVFMNGQTYGINEDGSNNWYENDVARFLRINKSEL